MQIHHHASDGRKYAVAARKQTKNRSTVSPTAEIFLVHFRAKLCTFCDAHEDALSTFAEQFGTSYKMATCITMEPDDDTRCKNKPEGIKRLWVMGRRPTSFWPRDRGIAKSKNGHTWRARSASLQRGSRGGAPSGIRGQSPWSGSQEGCRKTFWLLDVQTEAANLPHLCIFYKLPKPQVFVIHLSNKLKASSGQYCVATEIQFGTVVPVMREVAHSRTATLKLTYGSDWRVAVQT